MKRLVECGFVVGRPADAIWTHLRRSSTARVVGPVFAFVYGHILDRAVGNLVAELTAAAR